MRDETTALPGQGEARPERRVEPAVTIVVPTRNEAANVGPLVSELSTALAGVIVVHAGYGAAFVTLGVLAALGAVLFAVAMPETGGSAAPAGALAKAG